ncbi:hypothetical protein VTJ49DRAFT_1171 [Mycothermus thermophilus]|uniref:SH3 domain-containing protein n=1 Tax=Humicola insolens TaxID=85995 RepID=A0ABR3VDK5_HUMIN
MAQCLSLKGSEVCSAFQSSSVATKGGRAVELFPFLQFATSVEVFDSLLASYVQTEYVREKYSVLLGCGNIDFNRANDLYARFTTTVICNAIIQNSIEACSLAPENSRPVCADTCAEFAQAEAYLLADKELCPDSGGSAQAQIRADFTNCALPDKSLNSRECIPGAANEPENCGYGNSTIGLCSYCAAGGINSTDTCCYNADAETRCAGVVLPTITPITLPTVTTTAFPDSNQKDTNDGLSGGQIAGIVIGSVLGVALLAALLFWLLVVRRRRSTSRKGSSIFNQPSPARQGPPPSMAHNKSLPGLEVLPGGRIARMSALETHSRDAPSRHTAREVTPGSTPAGTPGYRSRRRTDEHSSSDGFGSSPASERGAAGVLRPPPAMLRRNGSLSSGSVLAGEDARSPSSAGISSLPGAAASQQSEQLPFFKDYYSQDDIHPGDRVAVLWAYQPRASDEFLLERGDMIKVVGIWDDGWATGVMLDERAEQWEARRQAQRDSGVSNTSGRLHDDSPQPLNGGEIKAFPLVCVCLPEHWRKTIDGEGSTDSRFLSTVPQNHGSHHPGAPALYISAKLWGGWAPAALRHLILSLPPSIGPDRG